MHLTEEKKGLYVQVLRIAKNYIKDGTNVTLLNAVCRVLEGSVTEPMKQACDDIARHIVDLLDENTNIEQWLFMEKGIDVFEDCDNPPCDEEMVRQRLQHTYLAWADYLSEHLNDIPQKQEIDELETMLGTAPETPAPAKPDPINEAVGAEDDEDDFRLEDII